MSLPVIALLGPIASGKSQLAAAIIERHPEFGHVAIDRLRAVGESWPELIDRVRTTETPLIVESVALLAEYRQALEQRRATLVCVTCREPARKARVEARDWEYRRPKFDDRRTAHLVVNGEQPFTGPLVDRVVSEAVKRAG